MRGAEDTGGLPAITKDVAFVDPSAVETVVDLEEALRVL